MPVYWVHVNHPTNKARIHVEGGCQWAHNAVQRVKANKPYGPKRGDKNGTWMGPFATLTQAQAYQNDTQKGIKDHCKLSGCGQHFAVMIPSA